MQPKPTLFTGTTGLIGENRKCFKKWACGVVNNANILLSVEMGAHHKKQHRYWDIFNSLPYNQGGFGRHKCAGCAYEAGYKAGLNREEQINMNLDALPES